MDKLKDVALRICQLFPKSVDNPEGYEPKPDEGRLLTDEEFKNACGHLSNPQSSNRAVARAQLAKDMEHEQAAIRQIFREIEGIQDYRVAWLLKQENYLASRQKWLLKALEGK